MSERTITIEINGMHCSACGLLVDDCVEDIAGVHRSRTDLRSGRCVALVDEAVSEDMLLSAVAEAGYVGTIV